MKQKVTIVSKWTENKRYDVEVEAPGHTNDHEILDLAWAMTNRDNRPLRTEVCATSVGDLMQLRGQWYVVDSYGFEAITDALAEEWMKLEGEKDIDFARKHGMLKNQE